MGTTCQLFTQTLKKKSPTFPPEAELFCQYLFDAAQEGHLCVIKHPDHFEPQLEGYETQALLESYHHLPPHLDLIHQEGEALYLQKHYQFEKSIADSVHQILTYPKSLTLEQGALSDMLTEEQKQGCLQAARSSLSLILGGPGCGKSFLAYQLLKALFASGPKQVIITAPTGKAAMHLYSRVIQEPALHDHLNHIECGTLHKLLKIHRRWDEKQHIIPLSADLIIVDESSMIDAKLMHLLLRSIRPGTHLLLIGDPNQLPPINSGALFHSLSQVDTIEKTHLTKSHRTDRTNILQLAHLVQTQAVEQTLNQLATPQVDVQYHQELSLSPEQLAKPFIASPNESLHAIAEKFNRFRILTPIREGTSGCDAINQAIYTHLKTLHNTPTWPAPILITQNDYKLELSNGETGLLLHDGNAYFQTGKETFRKIPENLLPPYTYAFAISVHKSQGSEYEHILLLLPPGSEHFGKEMLYTAITRAKISLQIQATPETLKATIAHNSTRLSNLKRRLAQTTP
ncbi:MAG: RecBCD enzyme subunit RecD [Chlamydiia bacterium]|nr:RecBCD enzyme subunit RecD [Chlamydiia bacterium]